MLGPVAARPIAAPAADSAATAAAKPAPCKAFALDPREASAGASPSPLPAGPLSRPTAAAAPTPTDADVAARRLVTRMLDGEAAVDRGLERAMAGRSMSSQELLVLQAQVIQYSQELDVASRVVDKATGAIRQVLQTQV